MCDRHISLFIAVVKTIVLRCDRPVIIPTHVNKAMRFLGKAITSKSEFMATMIHKGHYDTEDA